jgi:hypothetical protein
MFSNGSEAQSWQSRNCYRCWKYLNRGTKREKMRCKTSFDIDLGYITGELNCRVDKITKKPDCPYLQEKRPVYNKHDNGAMPLFEEVV